MTFPIELFVIFGVSILCSSVGLYKNIYFTSIGYGLSVAGCGASLLMLHHSDMNGLVRCLCVILIVYGLRMAIYLAVMEKGRADYRRQMKNEDGEESQDVGLKLMLWFSCAALYALMVSPICYRIMGMIWAGEAALLAGPVGSGAYARALEEAGGVLDISVWIGAGLMVLGLMLEWAVDISKDIQRKKYPGQVCGRGLYRLARCPGCFGELLLWTGVLVSSVTAFQTVGQWIIAGLGYLGILFVMFSGVRRLETG